MGLSKVGVEEMRRESKKELAAIRERESGGMGRLNRLIRSPNHR
jgi:hypothetical protein